MNEPTHLKCDNPIVDSDFKETEKIFRKFIRKAGDISGDFFSSINTNQFVKGVSVNRDKYGSLPADVLWSIIPNENNCLSILKKGEVIYTTIRNLNSEKNTSGIKVFCEHTPFKCNCSHCDLKFDPDITNSTKAVRTAVKLFMNTIFYPTGIENYPTSQE